MNTNICVMRHAAPYLLSLQDAAVLSAGYPLRVSVESLDAGNVPFIQLKNADPELGIDWGGVAHIDLPEGRTPRWLTKHDVIFASRGTRHYACPLADLPEHAVCAPHFFVLSIRNTDTLLPEFLAWQINQKPAQDYFQRTKVGAQSVLSIRRPELEALPIVVPPIDEQRIVILFWRSAQKERAALSRLIMNRQLQCEALARGLLQSAQESQA